MKGKRETTGILALLVLIGFGNSGNRIIVQGAAAAGDSTMAAQDSLKINKQLDNLNDLQSNLLSGKPTLVFFYYSVACSCTAARCGIAAAAIDSIPELTSDNESLNLSKIDAYLVPESESLYNLMIMPAVVYFDKNGREINRLEWGTSRDAIIKLINQPEEKQEPLD